MSLKKATPKAVFDACEQLELLDRSWNRDDVRLAVGGGSFSVIDPLIQAWRKLQPIREVAPTVPTDLLIQVATMLEQQVSSFVEEVELRDQEREAALLAASELLSSNLQQVESDLSHQLEMAQQANHDLEAEYSRLEGELREQSQLSSRLETKLRAAEDAANSLNKHLKEQQEFYISGLKLQKQEQQEREARLTGQNEQQIKQFKLESQQQLAQQKTQLNDAAELAENRLMRLLDQSRGEAKDLLLSSDKKIESLNIEHLSDKKIVNQQKIEINTLEASLQQVRQLSEQKILGLEAQLVLTNNEKSELITQLYDQKNQGNQREKSDLEQLKDSIRLLQNQVATASKSL
jgi:hypothetical protein